MISHIQLNPIFTLPIDLELEEKVEPDNIFLSDSNECDTCEDNYSLKESKNFEKIYEYLDNKDQNLLELHNKPNEDIKSDIPIKENDKKKSLKFITFSTSKENKQIKYLANSSRIYIGEIFRRNWKLKARRLITKMKQKLIKKLNYIEDEENKNNNKFPIITENNNYRFFPNNYISSNYCFNENNKDIYNLQQNSSSL